MNEPKRRECPHEQPRATYADDILDVVRAVAILAAIFAGLVSLFFHQKSNGFAVCMTIVVLGLFLGIPLLSSRTRVTDSLPEPPPDEPAKPLPSGLTPDDVDEILANMQDASPELRNHLYMLLKARMSEKAHGL
jgi:hypothetical protein